MRVFVLFFLGLFCLLGTAPATEPIDTDPAARVRHVLDQMYADDFQAREQASNELKNLPLEALPALESARASNTLSPEVNTRVDAILPILRKRHRAAAIDEAFARANQWNRDQYIADYDHGGHTDPRWDAAVHAALMIFSRPRPDLDRTPHDDAAIVADLQHAIDLGCDDPIVHLCLVSQRVAQKQIPLRQIVPEVTPWAEAIAAGNYSPRLKSNAMLFLLKYELAAPMAADPREADRRWCAKEAHAKEGFVYFQHEVTMPGLPPTTAVGEALLWINIRAQMGSTNDTFPLLATTFGPIAKSPATLAILHTRCAMLWVDRGVSVLDPKAAPADLAAAQAEVERAWSLDPNDPDPPTLMLLLADRLPLDRPTMEKWFARAMEANPNNLQAVQTKRSYLYNHANESDLLAFAKECFAGNMGSRIPMVGIDIYCGQSGWRNDGPGNHFFDDHPDAWPQIKKTYEDYFQLYPGRAHDRSFYANMALRLEHWDIARQQLRVLGDDLVIECFNGQADFDYLMRQLAAHPN